jgi:hypothetical protein
MADNCASTGDDCDVKIRLAGAACGLWTLIEIKRIEGTYRIVNVDPALDVKISSHRLSQTKASTTEM